MAGGDLDLAAARGVQLGLPLGRVVLEVLAPDQGGGQVVGPEVGGGLFLGRLVVGPDDERGPGLVDQDRVGLVDDREEVAALDGRVADLARPAEEGLLERLALVVADLEPLQLVAEEVEAEFLARAVGDVAGVGGATVGSGWPVWMQPTVMPSIW